jgi:hypothetical protein
MKTIGKLKWAAGVFSLAVTMVWLTGCGGNGNDRTATGTTGTTGTNAPASIAGNTINNIITSGTSPFPSSATFVLIAGGNAGDMTGPFTTTGFSGLTNSTGTFIFTVTGENSARLTLQDSSLGTVTESMVFQTPSSGTFSSTAGAGTASGTFTVQ